MKILKLILLGTLTLTVLNCGPATKEEITKTEVKKRKMAGDTTDYCEKFDWYDDGVCDSFCLQEDPECTVNCLAYPTCERGYVEVDSCKTAPRKTEPGTESGAQLPIYSDCVDVTMCGSTIHCQLEQVNCLAIALECPQGSTLVQDECPVGASCTIISDGCVEIICQDDEPSVACGGDVNAFAPIDPNGACSDDEFCKYDDINDSCGNSDAIGTCSAKPTICNELYAPVCGCDNVTYSNDCDAHANATSVASIGACETSCTTNDDCENTESCVDGICKTATLCGGFAGTTCSDTEFCDYLPEDICGAADANGICKTLPNDCLEIYSPVCGCDGTTYSNGCDANHNGVSVASAGECETVCRINDDCLGTQSCIDGLCSEQVVCGGNSPNPATCQADEFCLIATVDQCGAADAPGVCTTKPTICNELYAPVCGCDNVTYGNECTAWGNGASVAAIGVCQP